MSQHTTTHETRYDGTYDFTNLEQDLVRGESPAEHGLYQDQHHVPDDAFTVRDTMKALEAFYVAAVDEPGFVARTDYGELQETMDNAYEAGVLDRKPIAVDMADPGEDPVFHEVTFYRHKY